MNETLGPGVQKPPSREVKVLHFSSGEILTIHDSEDEEDEYELHQAFCDSDQGNRTWQERSVFWGTQVLKMSLRICDFFGEKVAALLGLNAAKYQYAIDKYHRDHKNRAGGETFSKSTKKNMEQIHLSQVVSKPYGSTNACDFTEQTLEEMP